MKKLTITTLAILLSTNAMAYGVLTNSWLDGVRKVCKYSDNSIVVVGMSEMCPLNN
ncbi:hypothetical protein LNL84_15385 [Vibrio sp. ZSDZ34]|uniref:DUF1496 domain-containing protein n=1 Tax=Vibrio gelatinilyticus TaxID=2893468 RepID=A0A9X1WEZ4_9VIBR|nr:hypothetical protein [Vibrio gelatinilyticus]MCJ2378200.1 hypothetical protein [Vibrio gelatinilyticus]